MPLPSTKDSLKTDLVLWLQTLGYDFMSACEIATIAIKETAQKRSTITFHVNGGSFTLAHYDETAPMPKGTHKAHEQQ